MLQAQALDALSALANETRLQIVRLLVEHGPTPACKRQAETGPTATPEGVPAGKSPAPYRSPRRDYPFTSVPWNRPG